MSRHFAGIIQYFPSAKAAGCRRDTSRTWDSGCWECCVLSGMFKWVLSGWNKMRGQLRGLRNALWWELVSLQEEFLSVQGAPVKYFKILSLPRFSCASPSGPVSQNAMTQHSCSLHTAPVSLHPARVFVKCLYRALRGALASRVLGVGPQKGQSLGKDCWVMH